LANEEKVITNVLLFWEKIYTADKVLVVFKKQDNTVRKMICTLNFSKIPKEKHPKNVNLKKIFELMSKKKILHVFDLEKNDWRSIPIDRVLLLSVGKDKFSIDLSGGVSK